MIKFGDFFFMLCFFRLVFSSEHNNYNCKNFDGVYFFNVMNCMFHVMKGGIYVMKSFAKKILKMINLFSAQVA